jgi:phage-related protein
MLKRLLWLGSSRSDVGNFPADARQRAGYQLYLVQSGFEPHDWKPMPSVGSGVQEIRVHTGLEHRVFYVAKFSEAIYVLHAFQKKTRKTSNAELELARSRLRELLRGRRGGGKIQGKRQL